MRQKLFIYNDGHSVGAGSDPLLYRARVDAFC